MIQKGWTSATFSTIVLTRTLILNKKVQNVNALFIKRKKQNQADYLTSLMKSSLGKNNELKFFDNQIKILVNLEKLLQEKESLLITNTNVIKERFNISKENSSERKRKLRCKKEGILKAKKPNCQEC